MLTIELQNGEIMIGGRFDASQTEKARSFLAGIETSMVVDLKNMDYISSAGLGVLLMTQKRLHEAGCRLKLKNMNKHIRDVFMFSGFDQIFEIES
jgi:anti-sigma B factor antagonist